MSQVIACREPQEFAAGDTLSFRRRLAKFPPTDGWSLKYEMRGGAQPIEFVSTADTTPDSHLVNVAASVTSLWLPAEYNLAGYAINGGERHQIYFAPLLVSEDLSAAPGDEDQRTFAQKMVEQLEATMLAKAGDDLARSAQGDTGFWYLTPEQLERSHAYWTRVRRNETAKENAKNGRATGYRTRPLFRVVPSGWGGVRSP